MNKPNETEAPIISFADRLERMSAGVHGQAADEVKLNDFHRLLVVGRGRSSLASFRKFASRHADQNYAAAELVSMARASATSEATQFRELEELQAKWQGTKYPTLEVLVFFWAQAKRSGKTGVRASLRIRKEFTARTQAIAMIFFAQALALVGETSKKAGRVFAKTASLIVVDYVETCLEGLPAKKVDFTEPAGGLLALDAFADAIGPISDDDLPSITMEVGVMDCTRQFLGNWIARRDLAIKHEELIRLSSIKALGKRVTTYGLIALGLPLH